MIYEVERDCDGDEVFTLEFSDHKDICALKNEIRPVNWAAGFGAKGCTADGLDRTECRLGGVCACLEAAKRD